MRILLLLFCCALIGCGGSGGGSTVNTLAGNWAGSGLHIAVQADGDFTGSFDDNPQSVISGTMGANSVITGTYQYPAQPVRNFTGGWSRLNGGTILNWAVNVDGGPLETFGFTKQ